MWGKRLTLPSVHGERKPIELTRCTSVQLAKPEAANLCECICLSVCGKQAGLSTERVSQVVPLIQGVVSASVLPGVRCRTAYCKLKVGHLNVSRMPSGPC